MKKAYCQFRLDGAMITCEVCGHSLKAGPSGVKHRRYCVANADPIVTERSRQRSIFDPRETDLQYLAKLLEPCNCPKGNDEQRDLAALRLRKWPKPEALVNGRWAVGVTTAPRRDGRLRVCLDSLRNNGWRPYIFAEPGSELSDPGDSLIRVNRKGAWLNWRFAAETMLAETSAELIMIVQDDTWVLPGVRHFIERSKWPADCGFLSLYLSRRQYGPLEGQRGIFPINKSRLTVNADHIRDNPRKYGKRKVGEVVDMPSGIFWGACAWVFKREILEQVLAHDLAQNWMGVNFAKTPDRKPEDVKHIDNVVSRVVGRLGLKWYAVSPSAAQHVAKHSAIWEHGGGGDSGDRGASRLVADWSMGAAVLVSGEADYDAAMGPWSRLFGRPDFPFSPRLWASLKPLLAPGVRVLEFGSGVSTRLIRSTGADMESIEQDPIVAAASGASYRPLTSAGWYDWTPEGKRYDLILIDGPAHRGREGVLPFVQNILNPGGRVVIDDCQRGAERQLAGSIASTLGCAPRFESDGRREWAVLERLIGRASRGMSLQCA